MTDGFPLQAGDPSSVGGYRLVARLGEGGQGVVYLAEDSESRRVAVKCLKVRFDRDSKARRRFAAEIAAAQRVAEFCTARVLDADLEGSVPYLVSEFVDGISLLRAVREEGVRAGADLERLAIGTATALMAIHQAKVVHRDFKPGNVLMSAQGPRVVDFGISRILEETGEESSQVVGTPAYMAPEMFSGGRAGPAVDIFAWGCTIVFAATGQPPFAAGSIGAVMQRIAQDEPDLGDLRDPLRSLVARCLDKDPAQRPSSEELLLGLLRREPRGQVSLADAAAAAIPATAPDKAPGRAPEERPDGAPPATGSAKDAAEDPAKDPPTDPGAGSGGKTRPVHHVRRTVVTTALIIGAASAAAVAAALLSAPGVSPFETETAQPTEPRPTSGGTSATPSAGPSKTNATSTSTPRIPPPGGPGGADDAVAAGPGAPRTSDGARPVPSPRPARAPAGTTTYKWTSMELSPQLKRGSCLYRVRYGNFSNVAFAQVRTYSSGCGNVTVSVYGQSGSFQGTWNSSTYSVRNHGDGCGTYNERQATSSENQIAIGMAVTFNSLGGTTRFMYHSGGSLPSHRNC